MRHLVRSAAALAAIGIGTAQAATMTTDSSGTWSDDLNWNTAAPTGSDDAVVSSGHTMSSTDTTASYSGSLTLESDATINAGGGGSQNAWTGASGITMNAGSKISDNSGVNNSVPAITLLGDASFVTPFGASDWNTSNFAAITGAFKWTTNGFNGHEFHYNAANEFTELVCDAIDRHTVRAKAAGSLGTGDVTITRRTNDDRSCVLVIDAADAMADTATLTLNGKGWNNSNGGPWAGTSHVLVMNADDTIAALIVEGVSQPFGDYTDASGDWISGPGTLTVAPVAPPTFPLSITPNALNPGNYDFSWESKDGKLYDLVSATDLATAPETWPVWQGNADIEGTAPTNMLLNVPGGSDPTRFFAVIEKDPPPLLDEGFEGDNGGFTVSTPSGATSWAHGAPNSTDNGGTANPGGSVTEGNDGSTNCWGTDIGNPGYYTNPTNTCLRSAVVDLTGVTAAELSFAMALDLDAGDSVTVNIIDDTTDTPFATDIVTITDGDISTANWESVGPVAIPAGAIGQLVRIEWCLTGTGGTSFDFMGWYIDDVLVADTSP